ncbi:unnamed protein product [Owenia fusiformis]|uniref:Superoxide dismutase copper/zinc binding domain-containing protein n=1 Tax=Owenia fusiformis TaxID=6347 RepID=A0A8J1TSD1_OWEFU|nr:unnamed protein product [Owenia fusiformis]
MNKGTILGLAVCFIGLLCVAKAQEKVPCLEYTEYQLTTLYESGGCTVKRDMELGCARVTDCPNTCRVLTDRQRRRDFVLGERWKKTMYKCDCVTTEVLLGEKDPTAVPQPPPGAPAYPPRSRCRLKGCMHPDFENTFMKPKERYETKERVCICGKGPDPEVTEFNTLFRLKCANFEFAICKVFGELNGTIVFKQLSSGGVTYIRGSIAGFDTADSELLHGVHIHTYGTLNSDCTGGGPHFNPLGLDHGGPMEDQVKEKRHVGDMGNIRESTDYPGHSVFSKEDHVISLVHHNNVAGRSIKIHSKADESLDAEGIILSPGRPIGCCVMARADSSVWEKSETPEKDDKYM